MKNYEILRRWSTAYLITAAICFILFFIFAALENILFVVFFIILLLETFIAGWILNKIADKVAWKDLEYRKAAYEGRIMWAEYKIEYYENLIQYNKNRLNGVDNIIEAINQKEVE